MNSIQKMYHSSPQNYDCGFALFFVVLSRLPEGHIRSFVMFHHFFLFDAVKVIPVSAAG